METEANKKIKGKLFGRKKLLREKKNSSGLVIFFTNYETKQKRIHRKGKKRKHKKNPKRCKNSVRTEFTLSGNFL